MRLNGKIDTKNRWETYHKIPYRGGRFIIESKNNRYSVVANLQRQFKNHYYLSSATYSTAIPMNSCFHFFLSFFVLPWGPVERRLTYCHEYVSCSNRYFVGSNDPNGNENVKKKQYVIQAKQQLCTCITLISTFLCRFCTTTTWNCLISRFMDYVNKQRQNFISLSVLGNGPLEFNSRRIRLHLTK